MDHKLFSYLSGGLTMIAFVPYAMAILKGFQPQKSTWIIWTTLDTCIFAGMLAAGTANGQIWGTVIGAWIVVGLALRNGKPGWSTTDKWCLSGAALGIVLWALSGSSTLGIVTLSLVVLLGSIPTFGAAWKNPEEENRLAWTLFWFACIFSILGIPAWTLADAAQPITFLAVNSVMMFILYVRPRLIVREAVRNWRRGHLHRW